MKPVYFGHRIMTINLGDAVRQLRSLSSQVDNIRKESKRFYEEKEKSLQSIQGKIDSVCSKLISEDASPLSSTTQVSNGTKRTLSHSESEKKEKFFKSEKISSKAVGVDFTVVDDYIQVYTDGACPNNGKGSARAGIGVFWGHNHDLNLSRRVAGEKQTNNVAEIQAASMSISQAIGAGIKKLQVNTDSQFLINCVNVWMKNWKKNGWITATGQEVKNKEDLLELDKLLQQGKIEVKWTHVKGHSDNVGNIEADKLAVRGANS